MACKINNKQIFLNATAKKYSFCFFGWKKTTAVVREIGELIGKRNYEYENDQKTFLTKVFKVRLFSSPTALTDLPNARSLHSNYCFSIIELWRTLTWPKTCEVSTLYMLDSFHLLDTVSQKLYCEKNETKDVTDYNSSWFSF